MTTQTALNLARPVTSYKVLALGGDATTVGLIAAAYAVVPLLTALWLGRLADRTPRLLPLAVLGALVLTLGGAVAAVAGDLILLAVSGVILGLGHLIFTISGQAAVARLSADRDLDLGFGWFTASFSLGQALGPLIGGWLMGPGSVEANGRLADVDRALWVGVAVAAVALPLLILGRHAMRPSSTRMSAVVTQDAEHEPPRNARVLDLLRMPGVASNMLASLALLAAMDVLNAFLPLVGERAGVSPVMVGWLLAVRGAMGIVSRAGLPLLAARFHREPLLISSVAGAGIALALTPAVISVWWLSVPLLAVGGFLLGLGQPLTMTAISTTVPRAWRSQSLAIRLMGNRLGQVAFPTLAGLLAGPFGPSAAIWVTSVVLLASGLEKARSHQKGRPPGGRP